MAATRFRPNNQWASRVLYASTLFGVAFSVNHPASGFGFVVVGGMGLFPGGRNCAVPLAALILCGCVNVVWDYDCVRICWSLLCKCRKIDDFYVHCVCLKFSWEIEWLFLTISADCGSSAARSSVSGRTSDLIVWNYLARDFIRFQFFDSSLCENFWLKQQIWMERFR